MQKRVDFKKRRQHAVFLLDFLLRICFVGCRFAIRRKYFAFGMNDTRVRSVSIVRQHFLCKIMHLLP